MEVKKLRIHIKLCKHCVREKKDCEYYNRLKEETKDILPNTHFSHNCAEYNNLFRKGERVAVKLFHQTSPFPDAPLYCSWREYENNPVEGTIDKCFNGFYLIKLEKSVNLDRVNPSGNIHSNVYDYTSKRANKITRLGNKWVKAKRASGLIEWICEHGVGHPDIESAEKVASKRNHDVDVWLTHCCDGCCGKDDFPGRENEKNEI